MAACVPATFALLGLVGCSQPKPDEPTEPPVRAASEVDRYMLAADVSALPRSTRPAAARHAPGPGPVGGPGPTSLGGLVVLEPSQGRPAILKPGDTFYFLTRVPEGLGERMFVSLVHAMVPELKVPLENTTPMTTVRGRFGALVLRVPEGTRDGLYDIELRGTNRTYFSRHSVKIVSQPKKKFRFVHLSNMNIGDPSAPDFDELLIDEINLLAPEFVVATGDFTEWGRMLDTPEGWPRVLAFLARIQAPTYLVCGDHDHEASFTQFVANSAFGTFDYGAHHAILLLDHPRHRMDKDELKWLIQDLQEHSQAGFTFIVTHDDELNVLEQLRKLTDLPRLVETSKLRLIITGGHTDWDYMEYAERLRGLEGLEYVRTHQSSTCLRDGATGVSHYRVIEVDGDRVRYVYPDDTASKPKQHSIAVGRLRVFYDGPNDGTRPRVTATVQNALNQRFEDGCVWLKVAKVPGREQQEPAVAGGRLLAAYDGRTYWACQIAIDLPDKGGVRVMAAADGKVPPPIPVDVGLEGDRELTFRQTRTESNVRYWQADSGLTLKLTNRGPAARTVRPIARLNGDVLPIDEAYADRWPAKIPPGQSVTIPLRVVLGRVSEGEHLLQVFFLEDPLKRLHTFPVVLRKAS